MRTASSSMFLIIMLVATVVLPNAAQVVIATLPSEGFPSSAALGCPKSAMGVFRLCKICDRFHRQQHCSPEFLAWNPMRLSGEQAVGDSDLINEE